MYAAGIASRHHAQPPLSFIITMPPCHAIDNSRFHFIYHFNSALSSAPLRHAAPITYRGHAGAGQRAAFYAATVTRAICHQRRAATRCAIYRRH